jgi:hypothetical protein
MNYNRLLITALILALVLAAGLFAFLNRGTILQPQAPKIGLTNPPSINLPVDIGHPAVKALTLNYEFAGTVTDLKYAGNSAIITLDKGDGRLPTLITDESTRVFKIKEDQSEGAKISDLQIGSKVNIIMTYNMVNWSLETVIIDLN